MLILPSGNSHSVCRAPPALSTNKSGEALLFSAYFAGDFCLRQGHGSGFPFVAAAKERIDHKEHNPEFPPRFLCSSEFFRGHYAALFPPRFMGRLVIRAPIRYLSTMSTVQEIESAITQLKPGDIHAVADWLLEYRETLWDKKIAADARAGKLDRSSKKPRPPIARGRPRLFHEFN